MKRDLRLFFNWQTLQSWLCLPLGKTISAAISLPNVTILKPVLDTSVSDPCSEQQHQQCQVSLMTYKLDGMDASLTIHVKDLTDESHRSKKISAEERPMAETKSSSSPSCKKGTPFTRDRRSIEGPVDDNSAFSRHWILGINQPRYPLSLDIQPDLKSRDSYGAAR